MLCLTATGSAARARDMRIGVVNIEKVFREYARLLDQRRLLKKRELAVRAEVETKNKSYRDVQEKRDLFAKGTPEYNKHNREMIHIKSDARSIGEAAEQELRTQAALALANAYNRVVDEIKNYGTEQGYSLILRFNDAKISGTSPDQVTMLIAGRRVLFSSPTMDLTQPILDRLNSAYASEQKAGRAGGASGK